MIISIDQIRMVIDKSLIILTSLGQPSATISRYFDSCHLILWNGSARVMTRPCSANSTKDVSVRYFTCQEHRNLKH